MDFGREDLGIENPLVIRCIRRGGCWFCKSSAMRSAFPLELFVCRQYSEGG